MSDGTRGGDRRRAAPLAVGLCLLVGGLAPARAQEGPRVDLARYASQHLRPLSDPDLALALAVSGGGHRAANFAAGVLLGLEALPSPGEADRDALDEVDLISTVSGGGFAVGLFVASLFDHLRAHPGERTAYSLDEALAGGADGEPGPLRYLSGGFLERLTLRETLLSPRLWFTDLGLGDQLERQLDRFLLGAEDRSPRGGVRGASLVLGDVFQEAGAPRPERLLPVWVNLATVYDDGSIFPFAPDVLARHGVDAFTHDLERRRLADPSRLPLSVALKASASYPLLVPATVLGVRSPAEAPRHLRLVDGGLGDLLGSRTALDLLDATVGPGGDRPARRVLLVVDAYMAPYPPDAGPYTTEGSPPDAPSTAKRTVDLLIDAQRDAVLERAERACRRRGVRLVRLGLDTLRAEDLTVLLERFEDDPAARERAAADEASLWRWYRERVASLPATLDRREPEQRLLLAAGRLAVRRAPVREALGPVGSASSSR